jgi:hypothetical protein
MPSHIRRLSDNAKHMSESCLCRQFLRPIPLIPGVQRAKTGAKAGIEIGAKTGIETRAAIGANISDTNERAPRPVAAKICCRLTAKSQSRFNVPVQSVLIYHLV